MPDIFTGPSLPIVLAGTALGIIYFIGQAETYHGILAVVALCLLASVAGSIVAQLAYALLF